MSHRRKSVKIDKFAIYSENKITNEFLKSSPFGNSLNRAPLEESNSTFQINLDGKLTAKLFFLKKLEKLQKQAVTLFYEGQMDQCIQTLDKCLEMLKNEDHSEHRVYVYYLKAQFYFKNKNSQQARQYYEKAMKIIKKMSNLEKDKIKEYLFSLQTLQISLLCSENQFQNALNCIHSLKQRQFNEGNEKVWKQVRQNEINAYIGVKDFSKASDLVYQYQNDFPSQSLKENYKMITLLMQILSETNQKQKAEVLIKQFIQQIKVDASHEKSLLNKVYTLYLTLFEDPIKCIYICKQWLAESGSDLCFLKLFHLHYSIGDYEDALFYLEKVSQNCKKSSEDYEIQAEIKTFFGQKGQAFFLLNRAYDSAKNQEKRIKLLIKQLKIVDIQQKKQKQKEIEKKIKTYKYEPWINGVVSLYKQYLYLKNQKQKIEKLTKFFQTENSSLKETGRFAVSLEKNQTQRRRYSMRF